MSSGTVTVVAGGLVVVAARALSEGVLAVSAGAVLLARAANAAAESAVRAIGEAGACLEADIAEIEAAAEAGQWRRRAIADVVAVSARLRLVTERAKAAGIALAVPRPLVLSAAVDPARAVGWVSEMDTEIARLNRELDEAAPPLRVAVTAKTSLAGTGISAELDRYRRAAADRHMKATAVPASSSITGVIGLLDPDATAHERDEVLSDAAAIAGRTEQAMYVSDLRSKVVTTLNPRIARRRLAATWVSALEDGPLSEVLAGVDPPAPLRGTTAALREVVSGTRELTPGLQADGARLMAWAEDAAGRRFMRDLVRKCLTEDGHEVLETFEGKDFTGLRMARPEWGDEHSAVVRVRDGNIVEYHLDAARAPLSDSEKLLGQERCAIANAGIEAVANAAAAAGVQVRLEASAPQVSGRAPAGDTVIKAPLSKRKDSR